MKLITLIENTAISADTIAEHGLSLYLETNGKKILFDMGQSDAFARNAEKLGIDLTAVDFAVISHGHYDHGGGLATFLKINSHAPVYIHKTAFGAHYNGKQKYIGLDISLQSNPRLIFTEGNVSLSSSLSLTDCNELGWKNDAYGLMLRTGEQFHPDDFTHEQYLQIVEGEKRILISGCSHKGILNIATHFCPQVLVGGFHLNKVENAEKLRTIASCLLSTGTRFYTGHCTGAKQFAIMQEVIGPNLQSLSAGMILHV